MDITLIVKQVGDFAWGPIMIVFLVGTGLYLTIRMGLIQVRGFKHAWALISGKYDKKEDEGEVTHFQALCTALSATIGTGNIAGVATAIASGGPGAVFWMW
ncbi:MAG: sodium:alanine symporter family protein, partial [Desulfobacterales bacterium]|nr:sodium:alanine symporter family protein [Desulfobacterales bacterium]